jgi:hypothetical protein
MSFNNLKVSELKEIAESFGVEIPGKVSKKEIVMLMQEEGITYQDYERFANLDKEILETPSTPLLERKNEKTILVKMDRMNFSYETNGVLFTREHPFVALPESLAQEIFDQNDGFRPATPREVQQFYS